MLADKVSPKLAQAGRVLMRDVMLAKPGEHVLITVDTETDPAVVRALWDAACAIDKKVAVLISPQMPHQGGFADPYISDPLKAAMTNADIWIELGFPYLAGSHAFDEAMKNGRTRYYLSTGMTSDALVRLYTGAEIQPLFALQRGFDRFLAESAGKACRITTQRGTDVTFALAGGELPFGMCEAKNPGLTGVLGAVFVMPELESVKGRITVENLCTDDIYTPLEEPVSLDMDGTVRAITGGGPKRELVERALLKGGGGKSYGYVVHFTCGIHPSAAYTGRCFVEDQRVVGYNAVGLGLPFWVEGGGETHPDTVMSTQSLWVDGRPVVQDGVIVGPPGLAKLAREAGLPA